MIRLAASLFMLLAVFGGMDRAVASCLAPGTVADELERSDHVLVGRVQGLASNDRLATVEVETVWKGDDLPKTLTVAGSFELSPNAFTSVDRTYEFGETYVFFVRAGTPHLLDDACTLTQPVALFDLSELEVVLGESRLPLDTGGSVAATPNEGGFSPSPWLIVGVVVVGGGLLAARALRSPQNEEIGFRLKSED